MRYEEVSANHVIPVIPQQVMFYEIFVLESIPGLRSMRIHPGKSAHRTEAVPMNIDVATFHALVTAVEASQCRAQYGNRSTSELTVDSVHTATQKDETVIIRFNARVPMRLHPQMELTLPEGTYVIQPVEDKSGQKSHTPDYETVDTADIYVITQSTM